MIIGKSITFYMNRQTNISGKLYLDLGPGISEVSSGMLSRDGPATTRVCTLCATNTLAVRNSL